jgi:hypothetical protein
VYQFHHAIIKVDLSMKGLTPPMPDKEGVCVESGCSCYRNVKMWHRLYNTHCKQCPHFPFHLHSDLDEHAFHVFLEKNTGALTILDARARLREADVSYDGKVRHIMFSFRLLALHSLLSSF